MRRIRRSASFVDEFQHLLEQGLPKFGHRVIEEKRTRIEAFIKGFLARTPGGGTVDPDIGLYTYPVRKTPFVIAYDFDADELHVHLIFHESADRTLINPNDVKW